MRLFVALDIEPEIRHRITAFRDELRVLAPDVKWVRPETFHVTLQFLGETSKLHEIAVALAQVKSPPVPLGFAGAGFFPNPRAPRVFWVGIQADEALSELVTAIGAVLGPSGFRRETAPYKPHLTLARSGSGRPRGGLGESAPGLQQVRTRIEQKAAPEFGTMTASEFYLYESKLSSSGPRYTKIARYDLRDDFADSK